MLTFCTHAQLEACVTSITTIVPPEVTRKISGLLLCSEICGFVGKEMNYYLISFTQVQTDIIYSFLCKEIDCSISR